MSIKSRSRKGQYRTGDIVFVPYMIIRNFSGKREDRIKILKNHYYVVTCDRERTLHGYKHDLEMVLLCSLKDRKIYKGQMFLANGEMPANSIAKTHVVIYERRANVLNKGSFIYGRLSDDKITALHMQIGCRSTKYNALNLAERKVYYRKNAHCDDMSMWNAGAFVNGSESTVEAIRKRTGIDASSMDDVAAFMSRCSGLDVKYVSEGKKCFLYESRCIGDLSKNDYNMFSRLIQFYNDVLNPGNTRNPFVYLHIC
jgi:hypothetical protein